jgi:DNA-binding SARP family transcriptional activator/tetratricopeptide (TPR) repeat protein
MFRLWLRGPLTAELRGEPVPMPTSERARALVCWLALHRGSHARADIAARLWPDVPDASARASLRTAIWAIRQAWGPASQVLVCSRLTISLSGAQVWVDVLDEPLGGDPSSELLVGVDDDWAYRAREEHLVRQVELLKTEADLADREGRPDDAVRHARRICRLRPLDESAHRDLLTRLIRAGDRAGAVVTTRQFDDRLLAELGVRPSPATRAMQAQLRANVPSADRAPRLFGRDRELAALSQTWQAAAGGVGQVVVLTGEAGIGKTSVLAELARRAESAGARTAVSAGIDIGGETPFGAWLELARSLVTTVAPVPATAGWPVELNRLSPELGARLGRRDPPSALTAPELERLRVSESVLRLVEWAARDRPLLIALDDAHRADRASLRLSAHVGRRLASLPMLLVLTRRDRPNRTELDAVLADLASRSVPITEIVLEPIGATDVAALAATILPMGDTSVTRVVAAAEGNPLLAVETARALAAGRAGPPPNLRTAVRSIAGPLPEPAQLLLGLLAVAGRPLRREELDALGLSDLAATERSASADGLLTRRQGRLGFRHGLLREAIYADLPDPAPLHDQVAAALDPSDRAEIAQHLTLAGRDLAAAKAWAEAAVHARSVGALAEAADFLVRATRLAPLDGQLWSELAEVWAWLGKRTESESAWNRGLTLLAAEDLPRAWCRRGRQFRTVICHPQASLRAYRQAEKLLTAQTDKATRAELLIGLAWGEAVAGDATGIEELLAAAQEWLPMPPSPETTADIAEIRMQALIRQGRFTDAVTVARSAAPAAANDHLPDRAFTVWINAACALTCVGDFDGALALAEQAVAATEPMPALLVGSLATLAQILARLGRHPEAAAVARRQQECAARLDAPELAATAAHDAGLVAMAAGRYADAAALLGQGLAAGAAVSRPTAGLHRAEALVLAGDVAAAASQLRAAIVEPAGRADLPWALVPRIAWIQGLIAAAKGDTPLARARFEESAHGWRTLIPSAAATTADGYNASLVDLGRPPLVGLIEPDTELARVEQQLQSMDDHDLPRGDLDADVRAERTQPGPRRGGVEASAQPDPVP